MFTAIPKSWFTWNFWLREASGSTVGELHLSGWRERGWEAGRRGQCKLVRCS